MRTKLAVHSMGNSPGHSLGQPRLDCTLAIYNTMYNMGLCKLRECMEFDQQYILVRENNMQLQRYNMYSPDTPISYCTYYSIFKSQKGSIEALSFLIITS